MKMMASEIFRKLKVVAMLRSAVMGLKHPAIIKVKMLMKMTTTRKVTVSLIRESKSAMAIMNKIKLRGSSINMIAQ